MGIAVERSDRFVMCGVDRCVLYAVDVVRMDVKPLRIALHTCRAHSLVLVAAAGTTWDGALVDGEMERVQREDAQAQALASRMRMVRP